MNRSALGALFVVAGLLTSCSGGDDASAPTTTLSMTPADDSASTSPPIETTTAPAGEVEPAPRATSTTVAVTTAPTVVAVGDEPIDVDTGSGTFQLGTASVPEIVSASFPLPDDLELDIASSSDSSAGFSGTTAMGFDELVDFYETELPAAGFGVVREQFVPGTIAVIAFNGAEGVGRVAIASSPGSAAHDLIVTYER